MELKQQIENLATAFESFKKTNDESLAEIKKEGKASALTTEKLEKTEKHIQELEAKIEKMTAALNRSGKGSEGGEDEDKEMSKKYSEALCLHLKKNKEMPRELLDWQKKAMSVDSDEDGGFFVTPEVSSQIETKLFETSPMRQLASVQTIGSNSYKIIEDLDEAESGWVGEIEARNETNTPKIKEIEIFVNEMYAQPKATQTLLDDASVNIEQWLAGKVLDIFKRKENTSFVKGDGVKKPKGVLAYDSGDGFNKIERAETAANNAVVGDDLISVQDLLFEDFQNNASWLINRLMISRIRKLKDSVNGQYVWQPSLQAGVPSQLLGRPVYMASDLPSEITAGADTLIYGDIKAGYQIVDRIGIRVLRDPFTAKPYIKFYTTKRVGGGVKNFQAIKVLRMKT